YCQNAVIAQGRAGLEISVGRLAEICLELQAQGALNVNFVTPTHYSLQIRDAVAQARSLGLSVPVVWSTSGYEREEVVEALGGTADVYLADYKYADAELARLYSNAPDYPEVALAAIGKMVERAGEPRFDVVDGRDRMTGGVIVRHLLLPGAFETSKRSIKMLWEHFGNSIQYSIMNQYTPVIQGHPQLSTTVPPEEYERLLDFADALGIEDYYWQEGPAAEESFIPAWDGSGVQP
ncbi:MAG: radical SAM protein, partial [Eggerthellaceae bacterium]|nr:radical SAM protein [Eggerthellaceae bacterium]